jgi:hypothetical protein
MNFLSGRISYTTSVVFVIVGVVIFTLADTSTWQAPSGITKNILGYMSIILGIAVFALRRGIASEAEDTRDLIIRLERIVRGDLK